MINLPKEIESNIHIHKHITYDQTGLVSSIYVRKPTDQDRPVLRNEKGEIVTLPCYYGEWAPVERALIDELNKDKLNKKKTVREYKETVYEKNLRLAKERLMRLLAEESELTEDNQGGSNE